MTSILDMVRQAVTPDLIGKMSGLVGETPAATQKALGVAVPAILAGTAERAATLEGAGRLHAMITGGDSIGSTLESVGRMLGSGGGRDLMQSGGRMLASLFGGRADTLASALASFAGIRSDSASSVLRLAAPIVMSVLGKHVASAGLDAAGLGNLLAGQRNAFTSAMPAGLSSMLSGLTTGAPGVEAPDIGRATTTAVAPDRVGGPEPVERERRKVGAWPFVLAGLAALALFAILFMRERAPEVAAPGAPAGPAPAASVRESASLALPDGRQLSVNRGGLLDQLGTYLRDASAGAPPRRFVFDDLNFEPGSSTLTAQSRASVESLGAILNAYPSARVALEGHTDTTGDPAANTTLSLDRGESIKRLLVQAGVAPERVSVVGHGSERPLASNDTEEERARNRRTELVVLKR